MLEIWKTIYQRQEEDLEKVSKEDSDLGDAAVDIIEYRKNLKEKGFKEDEICFFSERYAKQFGDAKSRYGFDREAEGFWTLRSYYLNWLDEVSEIVSVDEFDNMVHVLQTKYNAFEQNK